MTEDLRRREDYPPAFFERIQVTDGREQISPLLALQDHVNVFIEMIAWLDLFESWREEDETRTLADFIRENPRGLNFNTKTFSERFPEALYPGLQAHVPPEDLAALDALAQEANLLIASGMVTPEKVRNIAERGKRVLLKYDFSY